MSWYFLGTAIVVVLLTSRDVIGGVPRERTTSTGERVDDRYLLRLDLPRRIEVTINGELVGVLTGLTMSVPRPEAEVVVVRRMMAPDADGTQRLGDFPMTLATERMMELPPLIEMGDEVDGEGNLSDLIIKMRGE